MLGSEVSDLSFDPNLFVEQVSSWAWEKSMLAWECQPVLLEVGKRACLNESLFPMRTAGYSPGTTSVFPVLNDCLGRLLLCD